ncbi:MAG: ATP-binding cassette domain-containing protein, partial [Pseudomonadota bacterium]
RIIAPLQTAFVAVSRIHQVRASSNQLSRFMTHEIERSNKDAVNRAPKLTGDLVFDRVSFRYGQDEPAIVGASFHASPGEVIAILGRNGSGKSTILKLILGLYQPQMGSVLLDGHNIRQFDPADIRRQIAYVPQNPQFFEGTIAHNLRLVKPQASQNQIDLALSRAGVLDAVNQLPLGLESVITQRQPQMISQSTLARLSLARAYLKDSPIVLLDEPINGLDFEAEYAFVEAISNLKGKATVFVVTHRPSHMHASDKVLLLDHGNIAYFGETEKVKDKIPREAM